MLKIKPHLWHKGNDFEEAFAHPTSLKAIMVLLVFANKMNFKLFQMEVTIAFLNSNIMEKFIEQTHGFENKKFSIHFLS